MKNEKMIIDGNKLMMHLADWWYSSFGQEETEESKAVRKVMEEIETNLPKFALKEDGPWIPTDEALPEKDDVTKCAEHPHTEKVCVTAWPWATVEGTLETPEGLNEDQKRDFIEAHWSEIKFGKPSLDYTGTEYELNKSEIVMARKKPDEKKPDELVNRMSHAFYSILGCLADNMPDCGDDEYVEECNELYDSALLEFKNAEEEFRNGLTEK